MMSKKIHEKSLDNKTIMKTTHYLKYLYTMNLSDDEKVGKNRSDENFAK
jgi:hypothetical protein